MRVLCLNWRCIRHPQAGGAESNVFEQARRWTRAGHAVTVACADPGHAYGLPRDEMIDGIRVHRRGGRFTVYLWTALFLLRHAREFDAILDISNGVPFFAPLFTRTRTTLMIHHVHNRQWFLEFPWPVALVGWLLESRVVPLLYRGRPVIVVSPTTGEAVHRLGFPRERLRVIYNGVSTPPAPAARPAKRPPSVVYVGRLRPYKRLEQLVRMMVDLRHLVPGVRLDIAGDGDSAPALQALVEELGVGDCVILHGFIDDAEKARLLSSATVFATPSMHEGWGLSVLEANALGCPAVAYDVPGLSVAIRHGETGLLAESEPAFRAAVLRLLRDRALRDRYAAASVAWARRFDWDASARATLDVLQEEEPVAAGRPALSLPRGAPRES